MVTAMAMKLTLTGTHNYVVMLPPHPAQLCCLYFTANVVEQSVREAADFRSSSTKLTQRRPVSTPFNLTKLALLEAYCFANSEGIFFKNSYPSEGWLT